jgi:hypothetical protein
MILRNALCGGTILLFGLLPLVVSAAPYELGSGQAIRVYVRADVFDLDADVVEVDDCDPDTNEACQMIITAVVGK